MTRLDENRAISLLAGEAGVTAGAIKNMGIWGNHGPSMYPNFFEHYDQWKSRHRNSWINHGCKVTLLIQCPSEVRPSSMLEVLLPLPRQHLQRLIIWLLGTLGHQRREFTSMAVVSKGEYGVPEGLIFSFPVTVKDGVWSIVEGIELNAFSKAKIEATATELVEESEAVSHLLGSVRILSFIDKMVLVEDNVTTLKPFFNFLQIAISM